MSTRKAICPTISSIKRFSGRPRKNPNSIGVKKDEYTAHNNINLSHARYHLHCSLISASTNLSLHIFEARHLSILEGLKQESKQTQTALTKKKKKTQTVSNIEYRVVFETKIIKT